MNTMLKYFISAILVVELIFIFSCKKDSTTSSDCPNCPSVTSLSPSAGHGGDTITISGNNFAASPLDEVVKINGKIISPDSVLSSNASRIVAIVPVGCGSGKVTVDLDAELTNTGTPPDFTYLFQAVVTTFAGRWDNAIHTPDFGTNTPIDTTFFNGPSLIHIVDDVIFLTDNNANVITKISNFSTSSDIGINIDNSPIDFFSSNHKIYFLESGFDNLNLVYFYQIQEITLGYPQLLFDTIDYSNNSSYYGASMDANGHIYILNNIFRQSSNITDSTIIMKSTDATATTFNQVFQQNGELLSKLKFKNGFLYALSSGNNKIYKISVTTNSIVDTYFLGTAFNGNAISDFTVDTNGKIYFVSANYNILYYFSSQNTVVELASNASIGHADGIGSQASFNRPDGIDIDSQGRLFIIDRDNYCIRKVNLQ